MTSATKRFDLAAWRNEFKFQNLLPNTAAGLLLGVTEAIIAISFGSLIFSGELAPYQGDGIGLALLTAVIVCTFIAITSSVPGMIASVQDSPTIILALMVAYEVENLSGASPDQMLATVLISIASATFFTGLCLLLLGRFRLGRLVRFIPYPVVGGFLAGTGWLLMVGSIGVMTDYALTLENIPTLLESQQLLQWVPGIAIALTLLVGLKLIKHNLALPGLLLSVLVIFYAVLLVTGTSIEAATERGLLLGLSGDFGWKPLTPAQFALFDWSAYWRELFHIPILLALTIIGLLLNLQGLEAGLGGDVDPDRELQTAGIANMLAGLGGGLMGYHAASLTMLNDRIGVRGRLAGVLVGLVCLTVLLLGANILNYFPRPLVGGLLFFLGMDFIDTWVVAGYKQFSRIEFGAILLIVIMIATTDYLVGVAVGLVAMVIIFVVNYSRIGAIRYQLSGQEMRSTVSRDTLQRDILDQHGDQITILKLHGYIFFGTVTAISDQIQARLDDAKKQPVRYLLLDFRQVNGLDTSAIHGFAKVIRLATTHAIVPLFTGIRDELEGQIMTSELADLADSIERFDDLDHGLEWCEDHLIRDYAEGASLESLEEQLVASGLSSSFRMQLIKYLELHRLKAGERLITQGQQADDVYFVEKGRFSIYREDEQGERIRLMTLQPGTMVGEMALYLDETRTASVIADVDSVAFRISPEALQRMEQENPELAIAFHRFSARALAQRLAQTNRLVDALRD